MPVDRWSATAAAGAADHAQLLYQLSDLDGRTAGAISLVLRPILSISTLLMISRIILSWYPQVRWFSDPVPDPAPCAVIE
jgi:hypothetical protein